MPINHSGRGAHPYYHYQHRHYSQKKRKLPWLLVLLILGVLAFCLYWYMQPLAPISSQAQALSAEPTGDINITWPAASQAAIGSVDQGVLAIKPKQAIKPTASTAKIVTALTVLQKKPLALGEAGPKITMTQADVDRYNQYFTKNGSVAKVTIGQQLSQYQMLQGLLLPSANNYADSLAVWTFGSLDNYQKAAQKLVDKLGMKNTKIGSDASGFSPDTVSTPEDLTKLAIAAMNNKVVASIVGQDKVNLPVAGVKQNTNWLLGADGIIGVKTGNTDQAGGVYVFASKYKLDKTHSTVIVGAVQGEPTVISAIHQARLLLNQARSQYELVNVISKGQVISTYTSPWGGKVNAIASSNLSVASWRGVNIKPKVTLRDINAPAKKGAVVGKLTAGDSSVDIILQDNFNEPPVQWRVFRWL